MKYPTEFLARIGHVVIAWSAFEHNLAMVIITMISPDIDAGISVIKELHFRALADAALNVYRAHIGEDDDFAKLEQIINRAEVLVEERNLIVHSTFHVSEKDPNRVSLWKVSARRKGIKRRAKIVDVPTLEATGDKIYELSKELLDLHHRSIAAGKTKYVKMG